LDWHILAIAYAGFNQETMTRMKTTRWLIPFFLLCVPLLLAAYKLNPFRYDASQPLNIEEKSSENHGGGP